MMRMYKLSYSRLLNRILLLLVVCLVVMVGCGSVNPIRTDANKKTEIKIGVCLYDEYDAFINSIKEDIIKCSKEMELKTGVRMTVEIVSSKGSQITQNDQVEKFIARDFDVLCVNLVDRTDSMVIVDKAMSADIPVVFFNREPVQEDLDRWDKLFYVGAAPAQSGRLQAEIIIEDLKDESIISEVDYNHNNVISYVMLEGEAGHQDAIVRTQVCIDELTNAGFVLEELGDEFANWDKDQAKTKMKDIIKKYPTQIEVVIANNDLMALGAIEAINEAKYPHSVYVVGIDGINEAIESIKARKLAGSVKNDDEGQANSIVEIAYAMATGEEIPEAVNLTFGKYALLPYRKITKDNVYEFSGKGN